MPRSPAVLLVLTLVVTGCGSTAPRSGRSPAAASAATSPDRSPPAPDPRYVMQRVSVGAAPCGVVVAAGRVWVSNYASSTLQWLDARTGRASRPIKTGASPCGLAVGAGSVWVENYGGGSVSRVDARTGRVQREITVGTSPYDVAYLAGAAWVTDYGDGTVSRVDARTNRRTAVPTGGQPIGIAPSAGSLWVALGTTDEVVQIDAGTARVLRRIPLPGGPTWTAYTDDSVWVSESTGDVARIDTRTGRVRRTVHLGAVVPQDGSVVAGGVWVPCKDGRLFRIDVATNAVTGPWRTGDGNPFVLDGRDGTLWLPDFNGTTVARIDIARLT